MLGNTELPAAVILADVSAHSATDNLVTEANTDDADAAALETSPCVVYKSQDPFVVLVGGVLRSAYENGVDLVEVWVCV